MGADRIDKGGGACPDNDAAALIVGGGGKVADALDAAPEATGALPSVELLDLDFSGACCEFKVPCEPCCKGGKKGRFVTPGDCCKALVISAAAIVGFNEPKRCADASKFCW